MLTFTVALAALAVGWFARARFARVVSPQAVPRLLMLLYDGVNWQLGSASLVSSSKDAPPLELRGCGHTVPLASVVALDAPGVRLHVLALSQIQLLDVDALRAARETVDWSAMFTGGGQSRQFWQMAAVIVPLVVVVLIWFQIGGINSNASQALSDIGAVKAVLDKPLSCRVLP